MALKPEVSIGVALATAGVVFAIYSNATPNVADIRSAEPGNPDIEATRKLAAYTAVGAVGAISLVAKDPTVFILGGAMVIALDWWHRHANLVDPMTSKASMTPAGAPDQYDPTADAVNPATYDTATAGAF